MPLEQKTMRVTLKDVARHAGVSIPTVSLIMNGHKMPFKESTRQAVLAAVETLNYRPDSMARRTGQASGRRDAVGLLLRSETPSRVGNSPAYEFICGINDVLMEQNQFLVMVKLSHLKPAEASGRPPRVIAEQFVDGLIVESGLPSELEATVTRYRIPTIWLNTSHHGPTDCIYPDEVHAGRLATEYLIDLGHRRIMFVSDAVKPGGLGAFSLLDRQRGYEQAMAAHGLPAQVVHEGVTPVTELDEVVDLVVESRGTRQPVTGIVTYDSIRAVKLRMLLPAVGVCCPQDISIVVAEDLHFVRSRWPDTVGISLDRYQMGRQAAEMMLAKITSGHPQPSRVFSGSIIDGKTAAAVRAPKRLAARALRK